MSLEFKTGRQLEQMIADLAGLDERNVMVTASGTRGNFTAKFVGSIAAVSKSRAQLDIDNICAELGLRYKLADGNK